jgi:hypothetical protein
VGHDVLGQRAADAGDPGQQRHRRRVDVDADAVHAVLDHRVERAGELGLGEVVLVLPTPIDFGSIFTSSASGSCRRRAMETAPRSDTSRPGKLPGGVRDGRVHRGAGLETTTFRR